MSMTETQRGPVTVLALDGRLDAVTGPQLEQRLADLLAGGTAQVVLDCSALTYASSAGLRAILLGARRLSGGGGGLALAALAPSVHDIFTVSGLAKVLTIAPTVDGAIAGLAARVATTQGATAPTPATTTDASSGSGHGLTLLEELALLALDQDSGRLVVESTVAFHCALAGAAVADLALMGRIDSDAEQFIVLDATPTGHPLLDMILKSLSADTANRRIDAWMTAIGARGQELADRAYERLIAQGILQRQDTKLLWIFTGHRYRTLDGHERQEVKGRLTALILSDEIPDARDAILIGLLETSGLTTHVLTDPAVHGRRERIEALAQLDVVGTEVSKAVDRLLESLNMAIGMFRVV